MKKKLFLVLAIMLCMILAFTSCGDETPEETPETAYEDLSPEDAASSSIASISDGILSRDVFAALAAVLDGGSVKFEVNEIKEDDDVMFGNGDKISGNLYIGDKGFYLKDFVLNYGGMDIAGEAYVSNDLIYVSETELLEYNIGVKLSEIKEQIEESIFAYDSGSDYSLKEFGLTLDQYNQILSMLDVYKHSTESIADAEALVAHLLEKVIAIVMENTDITSKIQDVEFDGETKSVRVITITADAESLAGIVNALFDTLENDAEIKKFIEKYEGIVGDLLAEYLGELDQPLYDLYKSAIAEAKAEIGDIEAILAETTFEKIDIALVTPKIAPDLLRVDVTYTDSEEGASTVTVDFGAAGLKDTNKIAVLMDGEEMLKYAVESTSENFISKLYVEGECVAQITKNKSNGNFAISIYSEDERYDYDLGDYVDYCEEMKIEGKIEKTSDGYKISLTKAISNELTADRSDVIESDVIELDIVIETFESASMPSVPSDYNEISDITEADIERLMGIFG